jgi:hypothetical protein
MNRMYQKGGVLLVYRMCQNGVVSLMYSICRKVGV